MRKSLPYIWRVIYYSSAVYFSYLMLLISLQYIPIDFQAAFLSVKHREIVHTHYQVAFFSHAYTSIFVMIAGIPQFSGYLQRNYKKIHRTLGKTYITVLLFISGPSGLVMGLYAMGGISTKISFTLLAILWISFTAIAWKKAKQKQWDAHRKFMLRSYALTLSAVSLRLFKWIINGTFGLPPMDTYIIVSWLGWMFNLGVVELYIQFELNRKKPIKPVDAPLNTQRSEQH